MLWSSAIEFKIGNGINAGCYDSILFEGRYFYEILCIGSSGLQVLGGKNFTNSFAVTGFAEGNNLIAIKVRIMNDKGTSFINEKAFLVSIENKEGMLSVNTKENFLAFENGRVGAIDDNGYIVMQFGGDIFTTNPKYEEPHHFISERNICCDYLAGHIEAGDVMMSAEFTQAAKKAQQGKELELQKEIDALREEIEKQEIDFEAKYAKLRKERNNACIEMGQWQNIVLQMQVVIKPPPCYNGDFNLIERIVNWFTFRKNLKAIIEDSTFLKRRDGMGDA